jgi:hypothetical protein
MTKGRKSFGAKKKKAKDFIHFKKHKHEKKKKLTEREEKEKELEEALKILSVKKSHH